MKFSVNWLREYVELPESAHDIVDALVMIGHEVEEIEELGAELKHVVTGKIEDIQPHPNADRLVITQINDGTTTHQIVTGAKNVSVGDIVPAALPGAVLHKGFKIKASELRGVPSNGMLCSEQELGLVEEANGIWILPKDTPVGKDVITWFGIRDTILDVAILPNRGDCQSIYGLARDLAVYFQKPLKTPETSVKTISSTAQVSFENNSTSCRGYTGRQITKIQHIITPNIMASRLSAMGVQPINFIVDVTNYVLLETGQPLHAFDIRYINGKGVSCDEVSHLNHKSLKALDGKSYTLSDKDIVIAIDKKPEALAGVIGGEETSVADTTTGIFLESARFDSKKIRRMQSRHGIRTESSVRFEKGTDRLNMKLASDRAAFLLQTHANAVVEDYCIDDSRPTNETSDKKEGVIIPFSHQDINQLIGLNLSEAEIDTLLTNLGFNIVTKGSLSYATVPTWRESDCVEWPCLAEEVLRFKGFDCVKATLPNQAVVPDKPTRESDISETLLTFFTEKGFQQVITFPMVSPKLEPKGELIIKNPISSEESVMRTQLKPSLLKNLDHNLKRQAQQVMTVEIAKTYNLVDGVPVEGLLCEAVMTGPLFGRSFQSSVSRVNSTDFEIVKGLVQGIQSTFGHRNIARRQKQAEPDHAPEGAGYIDAAYAPIRVNGDVVGEYGLLHPDYLDTFDIDKPVAHIKLNIKSLAALPTIKAKFKPYSKFPSTRRDVALIVPKTMAYSDIEQFIMKNKPNILKEVYVFDVFESEKLGKENQSLGLAFTYQTDKKTLEDSNVNKVHDKLSQKLLAEFNVSTR